MPFHPKQALPLCLSGVALAALPVARAFAQSFSLDVGGRVQLYYSRFDGIYTDNGETERRPISGVLTSS